MTETHAGNVRLVGGALCLDFANTVSRHTDPEAHDRIHTYDDLVIWSEHAGILSQSEANRLSQGSGKWPEQADEILERALALRESLWRVFQAQTVGEEPSQTDVETLNIELSRAMRQAQLVQATEGFTLGWQYGSDTLDPMLWPIVKSAADLLTQGDLDRVRMCDGHDCEWLFVDTSRNGRRRWCEMETCGNRAKARRYYERSR